MFVEATASTERKEPVMTNWHDPLEREEAILDREEAERWQFATANDEEFGFDLDAFLGEFGLDPLKD